MPDLLLDDYDTKLLAKARIEHDSLREKDLKGHIKGRKKKKKLVRDFTQDELLVLSGEKEVSKNAPDMVPVRFEPKKDYQVQEALNYLKSFKLFKKLAGVDEEAKKRSEKLTVEKGSLKSSPTSK